MSDVVSMAADAPARAPLLRSAENPGGSTIAEILAQLGEEIAAGNAPFRRSLDPFDRSEFGLRQEVQKLLSQAASIGTMLNALPALRARAAEEAAAFQRAAEAAAVRPAPPADVVVPFAARDHRLPRGAYHPSGWPERDAA